LAATPALAALINEISSFPTHRFDFTVLKHLKKFQIDTNNV
jgi:hypothetical protein